jgi:hypothetical protein
MSEEAMTVVTAEGCGYPPNKYFLDAERKLDGVTI